MCSYAADIEGTKSNPQRTVTTQIEAVSHDSHMQTANEAPKTETCSIPAKAKSEPAKLSPPTPTLLPSNGESSTSRPTFSLSVSGLVRKEITGNEVRDRCREMIHKAMKKHNGKKLIKVSFRLVNQ